MTYLNVPGMCTICWEIWWKSLTRHPRSLCGCILFLYCPRHTKDTVRSGWVCQNMSSRQVEQLTGVIIGFICIIIISWNVSFIKSVCALSLICNNAAMKTDTEVVLFIFYYLDWYCWKVLWWIVTVDTMATGCLQSLLADVVCVSDSVKLTRSGAFNIQRWREMDTSRDRPRLCVYLSLVLLLSVLPHSLYG